MIALALLATLAAAPQDRGTPVRIQNMEVFGDDACPTGEPDEIIVCKRLPEGERFRMPQRFREATPNGGNQAWATRTETMDEQGRIAGGLPNTCSPVGTGGQTGCSQAAIRQWFAERRETQRNPAN